MLVDKTDLQAGNSIMMGVEQLVAFVGPTVAGILIGGYADSETGIGLAFAIDAVTFATSAVSMWLIRQGAAGKSRGDKEPEEGVWRSILTGIRYLWNDRVMRLMFLVLTAVNFLVVGPILVGIPVLADLRLPGGSVAFGFLMSAFAGGNLVGYLLAGSLPRIGGLAMRILLVMLMAAFGAVIGLLGFVSHTWVDFGMMLLLGLGNGYIAIILFTWMQTRTPKNMLGRMMSILMFSNTGLVPISQALSGAVIKWNLGALFASAGALILLVTLWMALQPDLRAFSESLAAAPKEGVDLSRA
jgi:hypothetical protein